MRVFPRTRFSSPPFLRRKGEGREGSRRLPLRRSRLRSLSLRWSPRLRVRRAHVLQLSTELVSRSARVGRGEEFESESFSRSVKRATMLCCAVCLCLFAIVVIRHRCGISFSESHQSLFVFYLFELQYSGGASRSSFNSPHHTEN